MWFWHFADSDSSGRPADEKPTPKPEGASDAAAGDPEAMAKAAERAGAEAAERQTAEPEADLEAEPAPASSMWVVLPWMTSLLLHVAIIILGTVLVWSYMVLEEELEAIVPTARLSEDIGGSLAESEQMDLESAQDVREVESEQVDTEDADLEMETETELELVGLAGGGGGNLAPFGTTTGADEMGAEFYGAGGNARRIAYVIDASGSMIDTMPFVIEELKRSITELSDEQEFTVVFYHADNAIEVPPEGWKPATEELKRRVAEWVTLEQGNIRPRGSTNPRPALQLVMRYNPELVFLLSDNITGTGRYEINREELLSTLNRANPGGRTAINTIQFMYPDALDTLEEIAENHGGVFRFVTEADLGLR